MTKAEQKIAHITPDISERVLRLETRYEHLDKQLNKIEDTVDKIDTTIQSISFKIGEYTGSMTAKRNAWVFAFGLIGGLGALGFHTFLFKIFGVEI